MGQIGSYNSPIKIDEENNLEIQKGLDVVSTKSTTKLSGLVDVYGGDIGVYDPGATGTLFLTELSVGDSVQIGGQVREIATVDSDTYATVTEEFTTEALSVELYGPGNEGVISVTVDGDEVLSLDQNGNLEVSGNLVANVDLGYTSYFALINQSGASDPIAIELQNTTGATITWSRASAGAYRATADSSIFTEDKTLVLYNLGSTIQYVGATIGWSRVSDTIIQLDTSSGTSDGLTDATFEVKIFNN